jgi:general stress protein 26
MRWTDLQEQQPRLGQRSHDRLLSPGVLLVVTIRKDGTPRLSPVEPFVHDGELWLSMMLGSRKAADLHRDPRVLVHSIVTSPNGEESEIKLRGTAQQATYIRYDNATGDQHLAIWPPGKEFVRRGTSATTVGDEEPVRDILR